MNLMSPLTIQEAQDKQPWNVPYLADLDRDRMALHCVLHAAKTVGKLAAVFEAQDHGASLDEETIRNMACDLITEALRFANLYKFDVAPLFEDRVGEKNNAPNWRE